MRQTGRTSRIIDFAVDQLFSCGEVIFTDHTAFEYPKKNIRSTLDSMCMRIRDRISTRSEIDVEYEIMRTNTMKREPITFIHMRLVREKNDITWISVKSGQSEI
jgi:hypothetical protein